jgi:hypothetical protein
MLTPAAFGVIAPGVNEAALIGKQSVELKSGSEVTGDVVVNEAGGTLQLEPNATAHDDVAADSVELGPNSAVEGDASFNTLDLHKKASIVGAQNTPLGLPVFDPLPLFFVGAGAGPDVAVAAGGTTALAPGDYGAVTVGEGGTLELAAGEYSFVSITVADDGRVEIGGALSAAVAGGFHLGAGGFVGPAAGAGVDGSDIVFYVAGSDSPQEAARLLDETTIVASFYVPDGSLRIGPEATASGGFIAHDIQVFPNTVVTLDTFFFNRPPVAGDDALTVDEGGATSVLANGETSLLWNDTDPNADNLSVTTTPVTAPAHGAVLLNADGTFTYTHDGSETTADSFEYEVCDDGVAPGPLCDVGLVAIVIIPVNDPPDAQDDAATTDEDVPVVVDVLANDSDADGNLVPSSVSVASGPANGTTSVDSGTGAVTYSPAADFNGSDAFTYEVCDDGSPLPSQCSTANVSVTVNPVNDDPVADPQTVIAAPNGPPVTITLTGSDVDGDSLAFSIVSGPFHGTLSGLTSTGPTSATVNYTPGTSFTETDLFEFQVDDGAGGTDTATVTITAEDVNDPPTARSDSAFVEPGGTVTTLAGGATSVLANDTDPEGDNLTVTTTPVSGPSNGTLTLNADGTFSYTHDGGASTSDSFVYEVCDDGSPVECSTATVSIGIRVLEVTVTVTKSGPGAADSAVISSPSGIDCGTICSAQFSTSSPVFLIAQPADGFAFDFWTGDPDCSDGLLTPSADVSCEAVFKDAPPPPVGDVDVTITKVGSGSGAVTSDPAGIDCGAICTATFPAFGNVLLIATPDPDSEFVGFGGDPDCVDGVVGTSANKTCTATFELLPTNVFTLTVTKAGTGDGAIVSSPFGISCGAVCSADFEDGTLVTLFVRPEPDSTFVGWSGDCTGIGFSTTVTMDADKTCTANFQ